MVFKSISEKIVIGKYEDGEVKNISSEDIDCCKKYGFAFEEQKSSENACINKLMNSIEKFKIENKKDNTSEEIQDNTEKDKVETRIRKSPKTKSPTPKKDKETNSIEEEILEEELPVETETDKTKTRIRKSPKTKSITKSSSPKKKEISPKKVLCDNAKHVKKTIDSAILTTNLKAGDVEQILGELQLNLDSDNDSDEDILEEEIEEDF